MIYSWAVFQSDNLKASTHRPSTFIQRDRAVPTAGSLRQPACDNMQAQLLPKPWYHISLQTTRQTVNAQMSMQMLPRMTFPLCVAVWSNALLWHQFNITISSLQWGSDHLVGNNPSTVHWRQLIFHPANMLRNRQGKMLETSLTISKLCSGCGSQECPAARTGWTSWVYTCNKDAASG